MCAAVLSVSSPLLFGHLGKRVHLARVHDQVLFHQSPACGATRAGGSPPGHGSASGHGARRLTSQWPHQRPPSKRSWRGHHWTASRRIHSTCGKVLHAILEADVPASIAAPSLADFSHQQARVDSALAGTHRLAQREGHHSRTDKGVRHQDVASVIGQVWREHTGKHAKSDGPRQGARRPKCPAHGVRARPPQNSTGHESDRATVLGVDDRVTGQGQGASVGERWRAVLHRLRLFASSSGAGSSQASLWS